MRLITILGIGGVGKTRLAVAVASHADSTFGDGALFVDLSAIRDPALVIPTLAASLEVHELAGETTLDRVESALRDSQMLRTTPSRVLTRRARHGPSFYLLLRSCAIGRGASPKLSRSSIR